MTTLETIEQEFAKNVENHVLTVIADDGNVTRHIRCREPGTVIYGWDIVTWPGYLAVTGDLGHYVFRRLDDMLVQFFGGTINPQYWVEKCVAWDYSLSVVSAENVRYMADAVLSELADEGELTDEIKDAWTNAIRVAKANDGRPSFDDLYDALVGTGVDVTDCDVAGYSSSVLRVLCAINWTREQYLTQKGVS